MRFEILTLFPALFDGVFQESIIKRAVESQLVSIAIHNIRDYAAGRHRITDDEPYGGGGGMVMKVEPIACALEAVLGDEPLPRGQDEPTRVILLSPAGRLFDQALADELAICEHLVLICGRYEGIDDRVSQHLCTDEISIGDYVLSGGEIPAMVVVEAVTRLLPGALGDPLGTAHDSHVAGLLEYPHYTRPAAYRGWAVPEVLLSGNHSDVALWRRQQSLLRTCQRRPELLSKADLSDEDRAFLEHLAGPPPLTEV
jgi:tRNA (guanine37-N1)-methyltransferase